MMRSELQSTRCQFQPAERLGGLSPYEPPTKGPFVDLVLNANEGQTPSAALGEALSRIDANALSRYPSAAELERKLADTFGIAQERVVVTNGGDDAIDRVCRVSLEPGRELLIHAPTFEMIARSGRLAGGSVRAVEWMGGRFPASRFTGAISPETSLVALVSPNNPTGGVISFDQMQDVIEAARSVGALVMVDLAYVEFADRDLTRDLLNEPGVVLIRTFSKAMGLAGARVGYALASPTVAGWLRTVGGPYPVSSVSAALAAAALDGESGRRKFIESVRLERDKLSAELRRFGCEVLESQANFVTARFKDAAFVQRALASLGVAVRAFPSRPELDGYLRITLPGCRAAFERLLEAMRTILAPEAILFDVDGVLADVSASYRSAIVTTARSFGVELTRDDIGAAKRAGGANNDGVLTKRLVEERGVPCELADVVNRFQRFYEGIGGEPGLREAERLIPDPTTLRRLGERFAMGIVTGRPRDEAEWFLDRAGLRGLFATLVCMEDAPAKPSPEPVPAAMRSLGVERAWMIGDTPDDIEAARTAGVLPIGVVAPGEGNEARAAMQRAGAAAVIDRITQIEEIIR